MGGRVFLVPFRLFKYVYLYTYVLHVIMKVL